MLDERLTVACRTGSVRLLEVQRRDTVEESGAGAERKEAGEALFVREWLGKTANRDYADRVRIIYGGSMKPENARGLLKRETAGNAA